ncbi:NAD(P)H-dependent FMN reductase [Rhizobium tropici]|uniref:NAD(P)H-dependent FMN reductase n=1 Tax=Rhizobium tropici TaxID=398 RepID=A0ABR6R2A5_RHITR|nr:NAD(P)H-dependent FMN reductase [Rhizobium tropici]MBB5594633.1 NAD(P)H-dependent FMN reductase [Rhizobium tropici]MBB6493278.1 NAD(P)H-dependent FMN reductase [Rhizobium tropici]
MIVLGISGAVRRPSQTTSLVDAITDEVRTHLGADIAGGWIW